MCFQTFSHSNLTCFGRKWSAIKKCFDTAGGIGKLGVLIEKSVSELNIDKNKFYTYETCNRGPLLFDRQKLKQLNYLKEHFSIICIYHRVQKSNQSFNGMLYSLALYQTNSKLCKVPIGIFVILIHRHKEKIRWENHWTLKLYHVEVPNRGLLCCFWTRFTRNWQQKQPVCQIQILS